MVEIQLGVVIRVSLPEASNLVGQPEVDVAAALKRYRGATFVDLDRERTVVRYKDRVTREWSGPRRRKFENVEGLDPYAKPSKRVKDTEPPRESYILQSMKKPVDELPTREGMPF